MLTSGNLYFKNAYNFDIGNSPVWFEEYNATGIPPTDTFFSYVSQYDTEEFSNALYVIEHDNPIPTGVGVSVSGVQVFIWREQNGSTTGVFDASVQLILGGVPQGQNKAASGIPWPTFTQQKKYGGPLELWELNGTLTPQEINSSGFGVQLITRRSPDTDPFEYTNASVDLIYATVFYNVPPTPSGSVPIYIGGHILTSGTLPFFIKGHIANSGTLPLYIGGHTAATGSLPLYLHSQPSGQFPLYIWGHIKDSGILPLFIEGIGMPSGSLPLYLHTNPISSGLSSGNLPLFVWGSTAGTSGLFGSFPLFVEAHNFPANLPLYLHATNLGGINKTLPLYTKGEATNIDGNLVLYLHGPSGTTNSLPLYIAGASTSLFGDPSYPPGGSNATGMLPLFLRRSPSEALPLFLCSNNIASGNLPLYIFGANTLSSGMNMFLNTGSATLNGNMILYSHGF